MNSRMPSSFPMCSWHPPDLTLTQNILQIQGFRKDSRDRLVHLNVEKDDVHAAIGQDNALIRRMLSGEKPGRTGPNLYEVKS